MGRHREWRKVAKKLRRKRIRQERARIQYENEGKEREKREKSPSYIKLQAEQEEIESFREQEERRIAAEEEQHWLNAEKEAQEKFRELQIKLAALREERAKQAERIKQEWKAEQEKLKELKEKQERLRDEQLKKQELLKKQIEDYISNDGNLPPELDITMETNPNKPICPFFKKTGVCRFKDDCSRNHVRPGISQTLLFPSFYTHLSLAQSNESEYGSDHTLEYDDRETYKHFCDFYNDVLPELEKCGNVRQFIVCCNKEPHLRGNVYIEYESVREAVRAYHTFQCRWYGGKQLNVEFSNVSSWKQAICGLNFHKRCPKGSNCNFLHVFRNPGNRFAKANKDFQHDPVKNDEERDYEYYDKRSWRWSESPERTLEKENRDGRKTVKRDRRKSSSKRSRSPSSKRSCRRSRSPSWERSSSSSNKSRSSERSSRSSDHHNKHRKHLRSKR